MRSKFYIQIGAKFLIKGRDLGYVTHFEILGILYIRQKFHIWYTY